MTHNVFSGTLNPAQSINHPATWQPRKKFSTAVRVAVYFRMCYLLRTWRCSWQ